MQCDLDYIFNNVLIFDCEKNSAPSAKPVPTLNQSSDDQSIFSKDISEFLAFKDCQLTESEENDLNEILFPSPDNVPPPPTEFVWSWDEGKLKLKQNDDGQHKEYIEQPDNKVRCNVSGCNKVCNKNYWKQHYNVHHSGDRVVRCETCGKKFKNKDECAKHATVHEDTAVKLYKCEYDGCSKQYCHKSDLTRHITAKHNDVTKYSCSFCNNTYSRNDHLMKHIDARHSSNPNKKRKLN